ncbi:Hypothetical_protein [Hexamita inflata]|uniref:Hypothetical_protein n=1 Tax=Hexamita inflata TaxID=28002 RepID=A0AA86V0P7_9EUKA|nr:Hypothetical protein HINF_LOCUS63614 [Hexamita inflata]
MLQHIQNQNQYFALKEKSIVDSIKSYNSQPQQIQSLKQLEDVSIQCSSETIVLIETGTQTELQQYELQLQQNLLTQQSEDFAVKYQKQQQNYEELLRESSASEFKYAALLLELNNVYQYLNQFQDPDSSQPSSWSTKVLFKENLHLKELQKQNVDYQKSVQQQLQIKDDHISQLKRQIAEIQKDSLSNLENNQKTVEAHQKLQEAHESAVAQNSALQNEIKSIKTELVNNQSQSSEHSKQHDSQIKFKQVQDQMSQLQLKYTQQHTQQKKESEMLVKRIMQVKEQNLQLQTQVNQLENGKKPKNPVVQPDNSTEIEELTQQLNICKQQIIELENELSSTKDELKKQLNNLKEQQQTNQKLSTEIKNQIKWSETEAIEMKKKIQMISQQLDQNDQTAMKFNLKVNEGQMKIFAIEDTKIQFEQLKFKQHEMTQIVDAQMEQINALQLQVQSLNQQLFVAQQETTSKQSEANRYSNETLSKSQAKDLTDQNWKQSIRIKHLEQYSKQLAVSAFHQ